MTDAGTRPATAEDVDRPPRREGRPSRGTWAAGAAAGLVAGLLLTVRTSPDVDLWLHLRVGDLLRAGERFGAAPDPLAVLADREYVPTQWLAQVAMAQTYGAAGMTGIQVVRLLLVLALAAAVLAGCRRAAGPAASLLATGVTMLGAAASWGERPQLAGMVLVAVTVALWWRASDRSSVPWALVPLAWLWACLHGTWLLGVAIGAVMVLGGVLDGRYRGRVTGLAALVPVLSVAAAALTPLGPRAVLEPFRVGQVAGLTANEWQRPALDNPLLLVVLAAAVVALLGVVRSTDRRWTRLLTTLAGIVLALWMVRTIAVGALVLAPAFAAGLSALAPGGRRADLREGAAPATSSAPSRSREWPAWALAAGCLLAIGGWHVATTPFGPPVTAAVSAAVGALPDGSGLAVDGRAVGWTQWAHRDRRPMRDLRAEVYSVPVALAYEDFQEARPGWQDYAAAQGITAVLADRERPLDRALSGEPEWSVAAEDADFRLWVLR